MCTHAHANTHTHKHIVASSPKFPGDPVDQRIGGELVMSDLLTM